LKDLKDQAYKLEIDIAHNQRSFDSVHELHEQGVRDADIVALNDIVKGSGSAGYDKLKSDIALHGDVDRAVKALTTQKQTLEAQCTLLDSWKQALKNSCDTFEKEVSQKCQKAAQEIDAATVKISHSTKAAATSVEDIGKKANEVADAHSHAQMAVFFKPVVDFVNGKEVPANSLAKCAMFAAHTLMDSPDISSETRNYLEVLLRKIGEDPRLSLKQWMMRRPEVK
jgi:hypothetical protein